MSDVLTKMFFGGFVRMHVLVPRRQRAYFRRRDDGRASPATVMTWARARFTRCFTSSNRPVTCPCTPRSSPASSGNTTATPKGAAALEAAKAKLKELVAEVLNDKPPRASIRSDGSARKRAQAHPKLKKVIIDHDAHDAGPPVGGRSFPGPLASLKRL